MSGGQAMVPAGEIALRVRALVDFLAERFGQHPPWEQAHGG
ncbi:hypothetical protein [Cupriavidus sp. TMH.W2]